MEAPLYDTSILIEHIRDGAAELEGSTTILNLIEFPKAVTLKGLDIIIPGKDDYDKGFEIAILLLQAGTPIPAVDVVLAA
ncbi:MAG: PIN domain-containing protein, partial [Candidatus Thorarchaeota archaeon]